MPARACFLLLLLSCPTLLVAQSAASSSISSGEVFFSASSAPGLPYTATYEATTVKTLSDGTTITKTYKTKEARDSQGRWFHEVTDHLPDGSESTQAFVNDPVDRVLLSWSSRPNVPSKVFVTHMPDPGKPRTAVNHPLPYQPVRPMMHRDATSEPLGSKTILGVVAEGVRRTTVTPVGALGNDRPIKTVTETWRSPDLNIIVSITSDDPREGHGTNEVTSLDRGEPDPALFKPPAGYEIEDREQPR